MKKNIIFSDVDKLKGVGKQLSRYLKKKKNRKSKRFTCLIFLIQKLIDQE